MVSSASCFPTFSYTCPLDNGFQAIKTSVVRVKSFALRYFERNSEMIRQGGMFLLNACILASKIFTQIPSIFPRISLVFLNYAGILWLDVGIKNLVKSCLDLELTLASRKPFACIATAAKVVIKSIDVILMAGMFAASLVALAGCPSGQLAMYGVMRPFATFSFTLGIGLQIYDYFRSKKLAGKAAILLQNKESEKTKMVLQALTKLVARPQKPCFTLKQWSWSQRPEDKLTKEEKLAVKIFRELDFQSIDILRENYLSEAEKAAASTSIKSLPAEVLLQSVSNHKEMTAASLALYALGYICIGIGRIYPDTLLQSALTCGMSLLYTCKMLRDKCLREKL